MLEHSKDLSLELAEARQQLSKAQARIAELEAKLAGRDISDREMQERQLRYFASLQESVTDAVIATGTDFRIQTWNRGAERIYGWRAEEVIGQVAPELLQIRFSSPQAAESYSQHLKEHGFLQQETIQRRKDGGDIYILGSATLLSDDKGTPVGLISVNRDITERKALERQLRYHASLQENVSDAVIVTDTAFRIQSWNKAAERIYGWRAEEIIGKTIEETVRTQFESDEHRKRFRQAFFEQGYWKGEAVQHRKDGTPFPLLGSITLLKDDQGIPFGIISVIHDITEQKVQERQLRYHASLQENVSDAVIVTDTAFRIQSWNKAAERIYGWSAEEVVGKATPDILHTKYTSATDRAGAISQLREQGWWQGEVIQSHKDGGVCHIFGSVTLVKDENGVPFGVVSVNHDITEYNKAQEALRESEARYRLLAENVSDVIARIKLDGTRTFVSPSCYAVLGYMPEELVGLTGSDIVHPDDIQKTNASAMEAIKANKPSFSITQRARHKAGHYVWVEATNSIVRDPDTGRAVEFISVFRDISERNNAEAKLREAEHRYHALFEQSHDAVFLVDMQGNPLEVNHRAAEMLGYSVEELRTLSFRELSDEVSKTEAIISHLLAGDVVPMYERVMRKKDGSRISVEINVEIVRDLDGNPLHIQTVVRDITERKRAEEALRESEGRYRLLAENIADIIMTFSLDRRVTYMSPSCESLLGYPPEEIEGRSHSEFIHPEDYPQVIDRTRQAVASKENFYTNQFRLRHKAGQYIWYEVRTRIVFDHNTGNVVQFISVLRDITERKRAEEALRESQERFSLLVNSVSDYAIYLLDVQGNITSWNQGAQRIKGYAADEILGQNFERFYLPEEKDRPQQLLDIANREGHALDEGWRVRKDGTRLWAAVVVTALRNKDDQLIGYAKVTRDLTERKQAEETLQAILDEEREFQGYLKELHEITIELTHIDILDDFYKRTVELGLERFGFDRLGLLLHDAEHAEVVGTYGTDAHGKLIDEHDLRFSLTTLTGILLRSLERDERFAFDEHAQLFSNLEPIGFGWNVAAVLWNGEQKLGWLAADNAVHHRPASKPLLDILSLYAMTIGTLLAQKRAQLALRESEKLYRLLADSINDVVIRFSQKLDYLYVSPSSLAVLGYEPEELLGPSDFQHIHPDDVAVVQQFLQGLLEKPNGTSGTCRYLHKAGHFVWLELSGQAVTSQQTGEVVEFVVSARDVTQRKNAEIALREQHEFLQQVINNVPGIVVVKDRTGRFQLVNEQQAELHSSTPENMLGKMDADFNPSQVEVDFFLQKDSETLASGKSTFIAEETLFGRYYQTSKVPLKNHDGEYDRLLVVSSDITERKKAEEVLQLAFEKEKELGELKSRFVSMASHEFRTPLATIYTITETLSNYRHKMTEDVIEQRLDRIRGQVNHLKDIMEDVLQLGKIQSGHVEFTPVELDLDALCREIVQDFQDRPDIMHQLLYTCAMTLPVLKLDKKLMRQVISNLISNAIKYSPQGKHVTINLKQTNEAVTLSVQDEGIGIPEVDLKYLFEPFHRAGNVGTIRGTGLGLTITKEAVELHGGTIVADSTVGVGTTFIVTIPLT